MSLPPLKVMPNSVVELILDSAGRHVAGELKVPANITLQYLPVYSPERNPVERGGPTCAATT